MVLWTIFSTTFELRLLWGQREELRSECPENNTYDRPRKPCIEILSLGVEGDKIRLVSLQRLEGALRVLLLKGFLVGYTVLHGDDTYPLLTDWQTRATVALSPILYSYHPEEPIGDIHVRLDTNHYMVLF